MTASGRRTPIFTATPWKNGYQVTDLHRECYIDGVWNKENVEDWLTEIQLPVK